MQRTNRSWPRQREEVRHNELDEEEGTDESCDDYDCTAHVTSYVG